MFVCFLFFFVQRCVTPWNLEMRQKTRENTDHFHTTPKWAPHETGGIADGQKSVAFISLEQEFSQFDFGKAETIIISRLMLIK